MFGNASKTLAALSWGLPLIAQQTRGMATLQTISTRLKSVKNIQKITQSMKMVSAAKYARAERELKLAMAYGEGSQTFYELAEVTPPENAKTELAIAVTSDKGLCGAVHSSVARRIRVKLQKNPDNIKIVCIGDKSKAALQRLYAKNLLMTIREVGRLPPVFEDAARIAAEIFNSGYEFDTGYIIYNKSISAGSYETSEMAIFDQATVNAAPKLSLYDSLDTDIIQSYLEFSLAGQIYYAMKENAASEQSARMTAMDSSSRNAGEMIGKLQLQFNRTRQAVITRELIEIISGASALD